MSTVDVCPINRRRCLPKSIKIRRPSQKSHRSRVRKTHGIDSESGNVHATNYGFVSQTSESPKSPMDLD